MYWEEGLVAGLDKSNWRRRASIVSCSLPPRKSLALPPESTAFKIRTTTGTKYILCQKKMEPSFSKTVPVEAVVVLVALAQVAESRGGRGIRLSRGRWWALGKRFNS